MFFYIYNIYDINYELLFIILYISVIIKKYKI